MAAAAGAEPPGVVEEVDLERYQGTWYEIARLPNDFQKKCASHTTATYGPAEKGLLQVVNRCVRADGGTEEVEGRARVENADEPGKLRVTFVRLLGEWIFWLGGDYWIMDLEPDYQWALIGHPRRETGWILARSPVLPADTLAELSTRLETRGYDPCRFMMTSQEEPQEKPFSLCEVAASEEASGGF